jgi:MinD superfamily P-loop ATPase
MNIAVASGKGGTGKTTVSVNLAKVFGKPVQLLDCDVEEPNAHLFLGGTSEKEEVVNIKIPVVDESLCDGCGACGRFCEFHAIVSYGTAPLLFPELCHGCGGCTRVCPQGAIHEEDKRIGIIEQRQVDDIHLVRGLLDIGVAMAPPLIGQVKQRQSKDKLTILDAPPGTSCPVIATIKDVDFVIMVTEPTPFGLNDLSLAVDMVRELGVPFGVVVNRMGMGDDRVHRYCERENIEILMEIPEDRKIAEAYSRGELIVDALPEYRGLFEDLWKNVFALQGASQQPPKSVCDACEG